MKKEKNPRTLPSDGSQAEKKNLCKDTEYLSVRQHKVLDLLTKGKHSVTDITKTLGYSDPRGYIRDLRKKGYNIVDEWINKGDVKYKLYYINFNNYSDGKAKP